MVISGGESKMRNIVQTRNPKSNRYIKLDLNTGKIVATKRSPGPYKNIPIIRRRKEEN